METIIKVLEEKKEQLNNIDTDTELLTSEELLQNIDTKEQKEILIQIKKEIEFTNKNLQFQSNLLFLDTVLVIASIIIAILTKTLSRFI